MRLAAALLLMAPAGYQLYSTGDARDVARPSAPGLLLSGGGAPDEAYSWFLDKTGGGDIVVLRASGDSSFN